MLSEEVICYLRLKIESSYLVNEMLASSGRSTVAAVYLRSTASNAKLTKATQIINTQKQEETKRAHLTAERRRWGVTGRLASGATLLLSYFITILHLLLVIFINCALSIWTFFWLILISWFTPLVWWTKTSPSPDIASSSPSHRKHPAIDTSRCGMSKVSIHARCHKVAIISAEFELLFFCVRGVKVNAIIFDWVETTCRRYPQ